jgi:hypothetical protein
MAKTGVFDLDHYPFLRAVAPLHFLVGDQNALFASATRHAHDGAEHASHAQFVARDPEILPVAVIAVLCPDDIGAAAEAVEAGDATEPALENCKSQLQAREPHDGATNHQPEYALVEAVVEQEIWHGDEMSAEEEDRNRPDAFDGGRA